MPRPENGLEIKNYYIVVPSAKRLFHQGKGRFAKKKKMKSSQIF
jgi:hypothetical protein